MDSNMPGTLSRSIKSPWAVRQVVALVLVSTMVLWHVPGILQLQAQTQVWANEYELKSAFVYRLLSFVDWHWKSAGEHLIVAFAGDGPMGDALARFLRGKSVGSHRIDVRVLRRADACDCHVLFIAYRDAASTREALLRARSPGVLTVGEGESFARQGGVVAFVPAGTSVQLAINPHAADRSSIKLSSKLLNLASLVKDDELSLR